MKRTGAQIVWEVLVREGVEIVFGFPGGAILPIYDAMPNYPVRHVLVRHEQGAAHMADGYARASGNVGVAIATSGPGATNLVTGIATAMLDSSPIVCLTGQVASSAIGRDAFQEIDITGITLPITKHNYLITRVEDIAPALREAFHIARSGRPGPVLVDITKDAQAATTDFHHHDAPPPLPGLTPVRRPRHEDLQRAKQLIEAAERPVILAGHGVVMCGATDELVQLAERTHTPVATTLLGIGAFPAGHELSLGMMGMHGHTCANIAIQEADLLLALGMRFDDRVTGDLKAFAVNARKVHIEVDPSEVNKNVRVDVAIIADLGEALRSLLPSLPTLRHDAWLAYVAELKAESAQGHIPNTPDDGRLYAAHVLHDLWRITRGKALVVTDVGQNQMWAAQYYHHDEPRTRITSGGLGTMGFALPAAIGAHFARPEMEVWVIAGDGGFQMTQAELATCVQEGIKLNIALINNGYLGMVRQWQEFFYERRYTATPLVSPDFAKLAEAHGLKGMRVERRDQIEEAVRFARHTNGTVIIDFKVEPEDCVYPMVPAGADLRAMIRRPSPVTETAG